MWKKFQNQRNPLRGQNFNAAFDEGCRLTDAAMRELGGRAVNSILEPGLKDLDTESPMTRRMHGAELRPSLMNTRHTDHQTERDAMTEESSAVSQGVVDMMAHLAEHLSSPEAQDHLSIADLLGRVGVDSDIATRIGLAHQLANPEDPNAPPLQ
jgi:hypothetical protein